MSSCKKDDDSTIFYWNETKCSDPWDIKSSSAEKEMQLAIERYLKDEKVKIQDIEFKIDTSKVQECEACNCTAGKVMVVNVPWADKRKMNFYQQTANS